ncbi:UDP-N-acetylglucosamine 1-carboxyvinyltransferase [Sulfobacillus harzensis]|uniref:UDP-N-acetylglucosamine 1-carboxyvinyltransferase n=1 Tax=Sulfobacillus harzensis TaxID=2729629 RepID=A0A7Y0Q273_9FIRM|nr:UDP-N-acetylglucosamine 1-carboxyvinyltransferase [Sulfobacillus harzensis]NMP21616.1 UDP-N-acetylglucosamine 1-carboxyvinyltransferase [Sulfobacillus harzensis]
MGEFVVRGGRRLDGTVRIHGAKNAALPIMAASVLASSPVTLEGVPRLRDVDVMIQVLTALGAEVAWQGRTLVIDPRGINQYVIPQELMQKMRASIFVIGPLLARLGHAVAVQPGGCSIGDRPIDIHIYGFSQMGAEVEESDMGTRLDGQLKPASIHLIYPSVGATENLMMAAARTPGETRIRNAAMEPEIVDLAQFLEKMGATVRGAGTSDIRIVGKPELEGVTHTIIPDRIEAATFALAAAATGGHVVLQNCIAEHLPGLVGRLRDVGVEVVEKEGDVLEVTAPEKYRATPISLHTGPYPGFATDMQAQFMAFLLRVPGVHIISERVFENRLGHARELRRMGAQIVADQRVALIYGGKPLFGGEVRALDLRAGAALVIAGLFAQGETVIHDREVIERGYEDLDGRLRVVGADIQPR